jgi:hypothetical protein
MALLIRYSKLLDAITRVFVFVSLRMSSSSSIAAVPASVSQHESRPTLNHLLASTSAPAAIFRMLALDYLTRAETIRLSRTAGTMYQLLAREGMGCSDFALHRKIKSCFYCEGVVIGDGADPVPGHGQGITTACRDPTKCKVCNHHTVTDNGTAASARAILCSPCSRRSCCECGTSGVELRTVPACTRSFDRVLMEINFAIDVSDVPLDVHRRIDGIYHQEMRRSAACCTKMVCNRGCLFRCSICNSSQHTRDALVLLRHRQWYNGRVMMNMSWHGSQDNGMDCDPRPLLEYNLQFGSRKMTMMLRNAESGEIVCRQCADAGEIKICDTLVWNPCIYGPVDTAHFRALRAKSSYFDILHGSG